VDTHILVMTDDTKSTISGFLKLFAYLLFGIAAVCFWVGGKIISESSGSDRLLGEMGGVGMAMVFGAVGLVVKHYGDQLEEDLEQAAVREDQDSGQKHRGPRRM
jgi:hypothetical protein